MTWNKRLTAALLEKGGYTVTSTHYLNDDNEWVEIPDQPTDTQAIRCAEEWLAESGAVAEVRWDAELRRFVVRLEAGEHAATSLPMAFAEAMMREVGG